MTREQKEAILVGCLVFSAFPMWRAVGGGGEMNLWQYIDVAFLRSPDSFPHQPLELGIEKARRAYCDVKGLNYESVYSSYPAISRTGTRISSGIG